MYLGRLKKLCAALKCAAMVRSKVGNTCDLVWWVSGCFIIDGPLGTYKKKLITIYSGGLCNSKKNNFSTYLRTILKTLASNQKLTAVWPTWVASKRPLKISFLFNSLGIYLHKVKGPGSGVPCVKICKIFSL